MAKNFAEPLKRNRHNSLVLSVYFDEFEKAKFRDVKRKVEAFRAADFKSDVKFVKWAMLECVRQWLDFNVKSEIKRRGY